MKGQLTWLRQLKRAFGAAAAVHTLRFPALPDKGNVSRSRTASTTTPCVLRLTGVITVLKLCGSVKTSVVPGISISVASVDRIVVNAGIPGVPVIERDSNRVDLVHHVRWVVGQRDHGVVQDRRSGARGRIGCADQHDRRISRPVGTEPTHAGARRADRQTPST